jgi:hypothetical protein
VKYTVEFEMRSDLVDISESVRKALTTTFGNIDKLRIVPCREYLGYIQNDQQIFWHEIGPNRVG